MCATRWTCWARPPADTSVWDSPTRDPTAPDRGRSEDHRHDHRARTNISVAVVLAAGLLPANHCPAVPLHGIRYPSYHRPRFRRAGYGQGYAAANSSTIAYRSITPGRGLPLVHSGLHIREADVDPAPAAGVPVDALTGAWQFVDRDGQRSGATRRRHRRCRGPVPLGSRPRPGAGVPHRRPWPRRSSCSTRRAPVLWSSAAARAPSPLSSVWSSVAVARVGPPAVGWSLRWWLSTLSWRTLVACRSTCCWCWMLLWARGSRGAWSRWASCRTRSRG
jgi:hypothetical protein